MILKSKQLTNRRVDEREFDISVVIPAYNAESSIGATIESVLNQTWPVSEIIVVNDGSTDRTADVVRGFESRVTLLEQVNQGVSAARNYGTQHASTDWIAYLDSDDVWLPEKLERQVNLLRKNKDVNWCATRYYQCVGNAKTISKFSIPVATEPELSGELIHALESIASHINIWVSTVLIRKSVLDLVGGFHTSLSSTADNDLWFRVGKVESEIAFVNFPLALYMVDPNGMSRSETKKISPARFEFFERLAQHIEDASVTNRPIFERIFDRYAGQYMFNLARTGNYEASRTLLQWIQEKNFRLPSWKYRWIHWMPTYLTGWLRSVLRATARNNGQSKAT